jgi:hypothetical protein
MGAKIFKYKKQFNFAYAPGEAIIGDDGKDGNRGAYGFALHFAGYDLNSSYYKDIALQRIENNYVLSNEYSDTVLQRPYKVGDLIVSANSNCYKIIESQNDSNYKFDIQYLGSIKAPDMSSLSSVVKVVIYDITDMSITYEGTTTTYDQSYTSPIPSNRATPTSDGITPESEAYTYKVNNVKNVFQKYGSWYKIGIYTSNYSKCKNVTYTLHDRLRCTKNQNIGAYADSTSGNATEVSTEEFKNATTLYKEVRYNTLPLNADTGDLSAENISTMFFEIVDSDKIPKIATPFISDAFGDRMHVGGSDMRFLNVYRGKVEDEKSGTYKNVYSRYNGTKWVNDLGEIKSTYVNERDSKAMQSYVISENRAVYSDTKNQRYGDSAYFTGMDIEHLDNELNNFFFNASDNEYYISTTNTGTHEVKFIKAHIYLDTTSFKGKKFIATKDSATGELILTENK